MRIVIIGNGIIANLAALFLRRRLPETAELVIVGPRERKLPVVGESTIEITAQFLERQLGLGPYLAASHYPKYALTYYFKLDPDDPEDRTYSVHCNEREPVDLDPHVEGWDPDRTRPPSWQLNRHVFDRDIQVMVSDHPDIERVHGLVRDVTLDGTSGHQLTVEEESGGTRTLDATWVVDASGRNRFLAKRMDLTVKPKTGQRDVFWFRLEGFEPDLLAELNALGPMPPGPGEPYHYDRYFSTHHFMGRGNWIWLIPMKNEERDRGELMSIGISSRPDVYGDGVASMEQFMEHVGRTHRTITDLVASGSVVDTNRMRNYHYWAKQAYSPDRWAIVGDAAFTPDPLFSNGLAFSSLQLEQVGEMIARDLEGAHDAGYIEKLDKAVWAPILGSQKAITDWYPTMDDAYVCSLRLNFIEVAYFYVLLPMVANRCHYQEDRLPLWGTLQISDTPFEVPHEVLEARKAFEKAVPEHFIYRGKEKVNLRALERVEDLREVRSQMLMGAELRKQYVEDALAALEPARSVASAS